MSPCVLLLRISKKSKARAVLFAARAFVTFLINGDSKMKTGLVLEGGALRGMYTAGVLDVFMENSISVDCIVGVSAGALFGVNYLSGQIGRALRYNKKYDSDKNYMGLRPFLREGNFVNTKYAYEDVPQRLDPFDDEIFMASGIPFYAVVTDIATGKPEYIRIESVFRQMDVLRASGSMPFVSKPVELNGKQYLDGGISDSIPYRWMQQQGMDKMIVILTQDAAYRKKKMFPGMANLYRWRYPKITKRLRERHTEYNRALDELNEMEQRGEVFLFQPSQPITVGKIERDSEKLQKTYDLGRKDGEKMLPKLREYLG